jgi:hypothetical protein
VNSSDDVGYKKPPRQTRFAKGQSGNPRGRPKGSLNFASRFTLIMHEPVQVTQNGRSKTMPAVDAILLQYRNAALGGDRHAIREVLRLQQLLELPEESTEAPVPHERDVAVMSNLFKRMQQMTKTSNDETKGEKSNEP